MKLSIIIPAYNEEKLITRCLTSVFAALATAESRLNGSEVIVADNDSTDATADLARQAGARVVFEPKRQIARARNAGAAAATGDWFLFVESIALFWFPLTGIASFWSQFQLGLSASERVFALIDAEPRVVQIDDQPDNRIEGHIQFADVDFRYTEQESVLSDFNLTIPARQTVALVGHTGAGKSSLGKLVARFYEYQSGQLLIAGAHCAAA